MIYLNGFTIPDESAEWNFFVYGTKETCFNTYYPYQIFPKMEFERMAFETVTIFYGGNGTGKTTIIKAIVNLLTSICKVKTDEIALLAPTGRASKKMMETTSMPAYTIHKYLGWDKEKNLFNV